MDCRESTAGMHNSLEIVQFRSSSDRLPENASGEQDETAGLIISFAKSTVIVKCQAKKNDGGRHRTGDWGWGRTRNPVPGGVDVNDLGGLAGVSPQQH